jgi:hypothetical protein
MADSKTRVQYTQSERDARDVAVARVYDQDEANPPAMLAEIAFQDGPRSESGVNGVQVDTIMEIALAKLQGCQKLCPSRETALAITKLEESLMWLGKRTADREARGVEGTSTA